MKCLKFTLTLLLFTLIGSTLSAQSSANSSDNLLLDTELVELTDENWSFYKDDENNIYYIDFEKIPFNLSDVIIKNDQGEVVLEDDVLELPVNTIYEIDFSQLGTGQYSVELRSFTGFIRKEISIK